MKVTFLGTGTSQGIPVIGCDCAVCKSDDPRDNRLRTSIHIETKGLSIIVDTGPDFRQQVLRANIRKLDAILFTHQHKDHVAGLDDVRSFNFLQKKAMPVYGNLMTLQQLKVEFAYAFAEDRYPGIPEIDLIEIENDVFRIENIEILPILVMHHKLPVFGFRIDDFVYITDAKTISDSELKKAYNAKVLVLNALQQSPHLSHFTLMEALDVIAELQPEQAYLTHMGHRMGKHSSIDPTLPDNVSLAFDGLTFHL
ncbi:MAG: MBL fold metallo-hydrolase [Cyclobacteriaceae bacterium]